MSVKEIIQEAINENPIGVKEALSEELRKRIAAIFEEKLSEASDSDEDDEEEDDEEDDDDTDGDC